MMDMSEEEDIWVKIWDDIKNEYNNKDGNLKKFDEESPVFKIVLDLLARELSSRYRFKEFISRGGASLVFLIERLKMGDYWALKIPRPIDKNLIESVKNEIKLLKELKHKNIMGIHEADDIELKHPKYYKTYPFFIMKYIEDRMNLEDLIQEIVNEHPKARRKNKLEIVMDHVVNILYNIAKAINYLHGNNVIHYDIKPDNILISKQDKDIPLLTDLGYAKRVPTEDKPQEKIVIGFTYPYAHRILTNLVTDIESINRTKTELIVEEGHKICDIYSFGKLILEIFQVINHKFTDIVGYNYEFMYLHLAACRMLDGLNYSSEEIRTMEERMRKYRAPYRFYKEEWLELNKFDFKEISYKGFSEIIKDFEKIIYKKQTIFNIPELRYSHPIRIQTNYTNPAPFSERIKKIMEHPLFAKLGSVHQLSFSKFIFPTATHSRIEHSLGTYRNCCLYIQSLYNDPYNPLFKLLVNKNDVKCLMLASLLHDLGHYPHAHDIEESISNYPIYSDLDDDVSNLFHENFTSNLLLSNIRDFSEEKATLSEIIQKYWNVSAIEVNAIIRGDDENNIKNQMLHSIIDGPIDVDKLDWLQRDSHNSYLKYGDLIDEDRLIRTLSVIIRKNQDNSKKTLVIGVYEKGKSAAESFSFARYLLYQSLYWHHTTRAARAMLYEAIIPILMKSKKPKSLPDFVERYLDKKNEKERFTAIELNNKSVKELRFYCQKEKISLPSNIKKEAIITQIMYTYETRDSSISLDSYKTYYDQMRILSEKKIFLNSDDILNLIEYHATIGGRNLIKMIKQRRYYKRIITIHYKETYKEYDLFEAFKDKTRSFRFNFQDILAEKLRDKFIAQLKVEMTKDKIETQTLAEEKTNEVIKILSNKEMKPIICDAPEENPGGSDLLQLIPEPHRYRQNYETRIKIGARISEIYQNIYKELMKYASKGRIFCHPQIRDPLLNLLSPNLIKECIIEAYKSFKPEK